MIKKILVIDDDEICLQVIESWLLQNDYEAITATTGKDGYEKCRQHQPDAIILDILMPHMSGDEVADLIKNDPVCSRIPIIFLTAMVEVKDVPKNNIIGGQYIIAKPFDGEELRLVLQKAL